MHSPNGPHEDLNALANQAAELDQGILHGWDGGNNYYDGMVDSEDSYGQNLLQSERASIAKRIEATKASAL